MTELLKQFIITFSTELFLGLLILGGIGLGAVVSRTRGMLRASPPDQLAVGAAARDLDPEVLLDLTDSVDALSQRVERLEVVSDFDRQLSTGRQSAQ
jgi:hypothetical protein